MKKKGDKRGKKCSHCNKPGHEEANCWKKHPDKAPEWFKNRSNSGEAAGSSVEVMLADIEQGMEVSNAFIWKCQLRDPKARQHLDM